MTVSKQIEKALFDAALNVSDDETRRAFLDRACNGDSTLRTRVERLLDAQKPADEFFQAAASVQATVSDERKDTKTPETSSNNNESVIRLSAAEAPGKLIGHYKLLHKIGEGGCGVVYVAEQEKPIRRRVALKIIRLGMDTESVIARFDVERQALALMDHPNIAHVLDAGATDSGRPCFVMELVHGIKITEYCDQERLDARRRLELFIQVCRAVQHAHQKGVIHRDIKPSNILVTLHDGVPVPKVIDFGIAKAT